MLKTNALPSFLKLSLSIVQKLQSLQPENIYIYQVNITLSITCNLSKANNSKTNIISIIMNLFEHQLHTLTSPCSVNKIFAAAKIQNKCRY